MRNAMVAGAFAVGVAVGFLTSHLLRSDPHAFVGYVPDYLPAAKVKRSTMSQAEEFSLRFIQRQTMISGAWYDSRPELPALYLDGMRVSLGQGEVKLVILTRASGEDGERVWIDGSTEAQKRAALKFGCPALVNLLSSNLGVGSHLIHVRWKMDGEDIGSYRGGEISLESKPSQSSEQEAEDIF